VTGILAANAEEPSAVLLRVAVRTIILARRGVTCTETARTGLTRMALPYSHRRPYGLTDGARGSPVREHVLPMGIPVISLQDGERSMSATSAMVTDGHCKVDMAHTPADRLAVGDIGTSQLSWTEQFVLSAGAVQGGGFTDRP
jgi:hypothetical protein